ncbi:MAG TPA: hypothetical protein PLT65_00015 [Bacilli bacterium]|nr:hypothetical protein [Bacilli bacterium]
MEIEFKNINYNKLKNLSFKIFGNKINCIIGDESKYDVYKLLTCDTNYDGSIYINGNLNFQICEITHISSKDTFRYKTINAEFVSFLEQAGYDKDTILKRIKESLKIVGLEDKRSKFIGDLSFGEQILLKFAMAISRHFKLLILDDIFGYLDDDAKEMVKNVVMMLKTKYGKTIVILLNDTDFSYTFGDKYIVIKKGELLLQGSKDIFNDNYEKLEENGIDGPQIVKFSRLVYSKKGIKFHARDNVKDLIKDIYRSIE